MELNLADKVVLVTGSSKGLGYSIASAFIREQCHVVVNGRTTTQVAEAARKLGERATARAADVTDQRSCEGLVNDVLSEHGRLDVLVCNVGSGDSVKPGCETPASWQESIEINLYTASNMVRATADALSKSRGAIVCISSICGQEVVVGAPVTYSAAKSALNAYVRGISRPLAERGVRINAVSPGNLLFETSVWQKKLNEEPDRIADMLDQEVAMKRLGSPDEISNFVVFLVSDCSSFATGSIFTVDGGQARS